MSKTSRAQKIQLLQKVALKHFAPVLPPEDRSVLDILMYACCLEDAPYDAADEAFGRLQESYFDWNEIRVTTITELSETLHNLPNPRSAAIRIKKNLQSLFEMRYSFDLEDMRKMNLGKAVQELQKMGRMTRFVLGYVVQHALGGHAVPVSETIMELLKMTGVVSEAEAAKGETPGLERAIPKTKGLEVASCLHQMAVEASLSPGSKKVQSMLKEAGYEPPPSEKQAAPAATGAAAKSSPAATAGKAEQKAAKPKKAAAKKAPAKATSSKKASSKTETAKASTKKAPSAKRTSKTAGKTKAAGAKKSAQKPAASKKKTVTTAKKTTKRKPR
ncbi:MAG: hypothetical protein D6753_16250 [Planctomycetota bacterium]|nr:MAG: hypothetical protein D6753_16250 [Planctomycetota bacterium]